MFALCLNSWAAFSRISFFPALVQKLQLNHRSSLSEEALTCQKTEALGKITLSLWILNSCAESRGQRTANFPSHKAAQHSHSTCLLCSCLLPHLPCSLKTDSAPEKQFICRPTPSSFPRCYASYSTVPEEEKPTLQEAALRPPRRLQKRSFFVSSLNFRLAGCPKERAADILFPKLHF